MNFLLIPSLLLLLVGHLPLLFPGDAPRLSVLTLAYPAVLAVALLVFLATLAFSWRKALWQLLVLALCLPQVRTYCPFNIPSPHPRGAIKVMTYNTLGFGSMKRDSLTGNLRIVDYILAQRPDICFLQETLHGNRYDEINGNFRAAGYHYRHHFAGRCHLALAAKYPIISAETVTQSEYNGAAAFRLLLGPADTLTAINVHLESNRLSGEECETYASAVRSPRDSLRSSARPMLAMLSKFSAAGVTRALMADTISRYIERHHRPGAKLILAGDFNDTPVSYAHRAFTSRHSLVDAFTHSGNGIGRTYSRPAFYIRIDHILHSPGFKSYATRVDTKAGYSDHYPLTTYLK